MKIATFNINNIRKRLTNLLDWLDAAKPDVVCLQELKAAGDEFPKAEIEKKGYRATWSGQKTWNGVAILTLGVDPIVTRRSLPGDPADDQEPSRQFMERSLASRNAEFGEIELGIVREEVEGVHTAGVAAYEVLLHCLQVVGVKSHTSYFCVCDCRNR